MSFSFGTEKIYIFDSKNGKNSFLSPQIHKCFYILESTTNQHFIFNMFNKLKISP